MQNVGLNTAYALGFAAIDFLLNGTPITGLLPLWARIGQGQTWPEAFAQTFGRGIDVFYQQFEAYREAGFPAN
jgi:hypothetical protein